MINKEHFIYLVNTNNLKQNKLLRSTINATYFDKTRGDILVNSYIGFLGELVIKEYLTMCNQTHLEPFKEKKMNNYVMQFKEYEEEINHCDLEVLLNDKYQCTEVKTIHYPLTKDIKETHIYQDALTKKDCNYILLLDNLKVKSTKDDNEDFCKLSNNLKCKLYFYDIKNDNIQVIANSEFINSIIDRLFNKLKTIYESPF